MAKLTLEKIKEIARRARDNIASDFTEHQLWHENPNLVNDAARDLQEQQEEEDQIIDKAIKDGRYYYVYWVFYSWEDYNWIASRHKYPRDRGEEKINVEQIARKDEHFIRVDNPQGKCRKFGKFLYGRGKVKFQDPFPVDVPATAIHEDILEGLKDGKYILALGVALDTSGKGAGDINFDPEQMNWKWDHWAHGILDTKEDVGIIKGRLVDVMGEEIQKNTDRKIIIHNRHSKIPLINILKNAWAFVSDHSGAAFLSMIEGVPAFFTNQTLQNIGNIKNIESQIINYNIFNNLAYGQWNTNEMYEGEAWDFFSKDHLNN